MEWVWANTKGFESSCERTRALFRFPSESSNPPGCWRTSTWSTGTAGRGHAEEHVSERHRALVVEDEVAAIMTPDDNLVTLLAGDVSEPQSPPSRAPERR